MKEMSEQRTSCADCSVVVVVTKATGLHYSIPLVFSPFNRSVPN
jgi:hypothetical protein